jgi:hypothetical protein
LWSGCASEYYSDSLLKAHPVQYNSKTFSKEWGNGSRLVNGDCPTSWEPVQSFHRSHISHWAWAFGMDEGWYRQQLVLLHSCMIVTIICTWISLKSGHRENGVETSLYKGQALGRVAMAASGVKREEVVHLRVTLMGHLWQ